MVTLEISLASGGADDSAKLCWKNDEGAEQQYAQVQLRATVKQETFPGHRWLLRGEQTGKVLWEGVAAARPAVQPIVVHVRERAGDDNDEGEGEEAEAAPREGEGEATAPDDGADADAAPTGIWTGADGLHRFERLPRAGRDGEVVWRQLDSAGREVARLEQLEARVDTRWLWWTTAMFAKFTGMSGDTEHLVWCALTIAAAYNLDSAIPWPPALRAAAARVGPQPAALLCLLLILVMAAVAAAVPLRDTSVLLYNPTERTELRLADTAGHARPPSNRPGYQSAWTPVCKGGFAQLPPDLVQLRSERGFHAAFCVGAVAAIVAAGLKGARQ